MIIHTNLCKTKSFLGSWKVWFNYINKKKKKEKLAYFWPIFAFELKGKGSRAEPSWKSFSSSSSSSQLGSNSSLIVSDTVYSSVDSNTVWIKEIKKMRVYIIIIARVETQMDHSPTNNTKLAISFSFFWNRNSTFFYSGLSFHFPAISRLLG